MLDLGQAAKVPLKLPNNTIANVKTKCQNQALQQKKSRHSYVV